MPFDEEYRRDMYGRRDLNNDCLKIYLSNSIRCNVACVCDDAAFNQVGLVLQDMMHWSRNNNDNNNEHNNFILSWHKTCSLYHCHIIILNNNDIKLHSSKTKLMHAHPLFSSQM